MTAHKKPRQKDYPLSFPTMRFWQGQLNESGIRNYPKSNVGTKSVYLYRLAAFNKWLPGRQFDVRVQAVADGRIIRKSVQKSFGNVEELLRFGEEGNENEVKRIMKAYLVDPQHRNLKRSTMAGICSAINSYFGVHDVKIGVKLNGRKRDEFEVTDEPELGLVEFYKMMTTGDMGPMMRAVMLVLFQAGLDRSTLADRFNFYAHSQIAKFCGTSDYRGWRLDACPIPILLRRVKTGVKFTTFIERDALDAIKKYLAWKEEHHGPHDPNGAMFITARGKPIYGEWISTAFRSTAASSGLQRRLAPHVLKIQVHKTRRLLKSTLMACGCAAWAADHVIGHAPKDAYEGTPGLFPKELRREYAKASHMVNILSKAASKIDDTSSPDATEKALEASEARNEELMKKLNEAHGLLARKDARKADEDSRLEMVVKAIIDASGDPGGDFRRNLKARLDGLL